VKASILASSFWPLATTTLRRLFLLNGFIKAKKFCSLNLFLSPLDTPDEDGRDQSPLHLRLYGNRLTFAFAMEFLFRRFSAAGLKGNERTHEVDDGPSRVLPDIIIHAPVGRHYIC